MTEAASVKTKLYTAYTLLSLIFGGAGVERLKAVYDWKQNVDKRGYSAEKAGSFLFQPSGIIAPDGHELTRQELLDLVLANVVKNSAGYKLKQ